MEYGGITSGTSLYSTSSECYAEAFWSFGIGGNLYLRCMLSKNLFMSGGIIFTYNVIDTTVDATSKVGYMNESDAASYSFTPSISIGCKL